MTDDFHDCPNCGRRVIVIDRLGSNMLCDATVIVVGDERRDWGTSGPHQCPEAR